MDSETKLSKLHPLTAAAAVAVILVSVTGIAAMTGLLPDFSKTTEPTNLALAAASQPATTAVSPAPAETTPAKKPAVKRPTVVASTTVQPNSQPTAATQQAPAVQLPAPSSVCANCGVVESVTPIQQQPPASGLGAAAGALLGGVLGHQVGAGNGKTLATIAGAVGGGLAGNAVEKNRTTSTQYDVIVRMEDGRRQRFILKEQRWRSGDQVQIVNGFLSERTQ